MSGNKLEVDPRFFFFSAHAETVAPVLRFFNKRDLDPLTPAPTSMILFDFYDEADISWVSAKYVKDDIAVTFLDVKSDYFKNRVQKKLNA